MTQPTLQYLNECFIHDRDTGTLTWKERPRHHFDNEHAWLMARGRDAGKPVKGGLNGGYYCVQLGNKKYKVHRVIWALLYGIDMDKVPPAIDHIDLDKTNNRENNLREATWSQNCMNKGLQANNTSGVKGVHWHSGKKKWVATIKIKQKLHSLGNFKKFEDAVAARMAAQGMHGEFSRFAANDNVIAAMTDVA